MNPVPDTEPPIINEFNSSPKTQGYGKLVRIWANVTDNVGIEFVKANITYPNGTSIWLQLLYSGTPTIYENYWSYCDNTRLAKFKRLFLVWKRFFDGSSFKLETKIKKHNK